MWIVAYSNCSHGKRNKRAKRTQEKYPNLDGTSQLADAKNKGDVWRQWVMGFAQQKYDSAKSSANGRRQWWKSEPNLGRVAHGVAARVDRLKAIGNGQVPLCAAEAWKLLNE
jgi:DNA (cytosine-5)-methyltransferase 1